MSELSQKIAVITGPTSGIGQAFAYNLASQGYSLILIARRDAILKRLAKELSTSYNIEVKYLVADLSKEDDITKIADYLGELKSVDLLINNAGFGCAGYFLEIPIEEQLQMLNVHLTSTIRFCRAVIPHMVKQNHGAIINVASFAAFMNMPGSVMYSTSKAAIVKFTQSLNNEVKNYGIQVQALSPGFTRTSFHSSIKREAKFVNKIPSFLWTNADEVVVSSLKKLDSRGVICIPGLTNKVLYYLNRYTFLSTVFEYVAERKQQASRNDIYHKKGTTQSTIGKKIASL